MLRDKFQTVAVIAMLLSLTALLGCGGDAGRPTVGTPALSPVAAPSLAGRDSDGDGVADALELKIGTSPDAIDTDGDGLTDHYELWGVSGLAVGQVGALEALPDANGDGVIAALDRMEAGTVLLKSTSQLEQERIRVPFPDVDAQPENDLDDDWIPSDFELHGFCYEMDPISGEDYFIKWDGDISKEYFKTDPTKWSTDGDPWSDWEEATKINLDQRVKWPGDHPCIPAYPELLTCLGDYSIELNQDTEITTATGRTTEREWTNSVQTAWEEADVAGRGGEWLGGIIFEKTAAEWYLGGHVEAEGYGVSGSSTVDSSVTVTSNSGIESQEWSNAELTSGNSLAAARITMNIKLLNTGTLPASNPEILLNLRLGDVAITSFMVVYEGELKPMARNVVNFSVRTDGFTSQAQPLGNPMMLSMNQLRSIERGAPINIEMVSFEADTLVWEMDPETGRRQYITTGDWSPYKAAIENVTARIVVDFNDHPLISPPLYHGVPAKRVCDVRVFGYDNSGMYVGSPPRTTLADAMIWAFETKDTVDGPFVTIRDPISKLHHRSYMADWRFGLDRQLIEELIEDPDKYGGGVFDVPLFPGNPEERVYVAKAPLDNTLAKPTIYWANVIPRERKVRAYSFDVNGIKEMRFKPEEGYIGELMSTAFEPEDPESMFFHYYDIPLQYKWTGREKVVAVNRLGTATELDILIEGDELGYEVASGHLFFEWMPVGGAAESYSRKLNLEAGSEDEVVFGPFDVELLQLRAGAGEALERRLIPLNGAALYDVEIVADPELLDYNFLRKRPYQEMELTIPADPPLYPLAEPLWRNVYAVRGRFGSVAVLVPELTQAITGEWYVSGVSWSRFVGI